MTDRPSNEQIESGFARKRIRGLKLCVLVAMPAWEHTGIIREGSGLSGAWRKWIISI